MDPLSAMLFAIMLSGIAVKTGASGIADVAASRKGHTPPSLQRWNARQEKRKQRGQPQEKDPGPWRRRWRNNVEERTERAAQKHQARMKFLRDNADTNAAKHQQRLQKRADIRERAAARVADLGSSSWEVTKQAALNARDAHTERKVAKQAWEENGRRDTDGGEHDERVTRWRAALDRGSDLDVLTAEEWNTLPPETRDRLIDEAEAAGYSVLQRSSDGRESRLQQVGTGDEHQDDDTYLLGTDVSHQQSAESAAGEPAPSWFYTDPETGDELGIYTTHDGEQALYEPRFDGDPEPYWDSGNTERRYRPEQVGTHFEHNTDMPATTPRSLAELPHINNSEGVSTMSAPAHSGEITDLPSALAYVTSSSQYCQQISGTFENAQAQSQATARELRDQLGHLEAAQSSLAGQGLHDEAARLSGVAEHFASLAQSMEQVETLLSSTTDALGAAQSELDTSAREFQSQQGIAEAVQSHRSVADNTAFYANA